MLAELGVMRDQGEGIPRMFEEMEVAFLPVPALEVVSGRFRVVLRKEPIFASDDRAWPQAVRALPISLTQKRALVGLVDREFANADYCALNGVDRDIAYRDLHELVERGLITTSGTGAGVRYSVLRDVPPGRPPARSSSSISGCARPGSSPTPTTARRSAPTAMPRPQLFLRGPLRASSFERANGAARDIDRARDGLLVDGRYAELCPACGITTRYR